MAGVLALSLASTASAQTNRVDGIRPDAPQLAARGKQAVGVGTLTLVNKGQVNVPAVRAGQPNPTYDRSLTIEVWYPGSLPEGARAGVEYHTLTRDGRTPATFYGSATRFIAPDASGAPYPLVILSHGYPGNRILMAHFGENLASKGYVVASIDHKESLYQDQTAFGGTLLNRALDDLFVLNEIDRLSKDSSGFLAGLVDASRTGIIGYSMGAYGALNLVGAGVTQAAVRSALAPANELLGMRAAGDPRYTASLEPRVKAVVAIAPWGFNAGLWDAAGLAGVKTPVFFMAGSVDATAGYNPGVRNLFEGTVNADRYLLTFANGGHSVAAPIPAPREVSGPGSTTLGHYTDAVWDQVRSNNVAQHFATAFLGKHLKADAGMDSFLNVIENGGAGKYSVEANGTPRADHTYWKGFANNTAVGLTLEHRTPGK
ncbi:MAG TPA: dienelactone hydrolase [Deinococcales bacterium]|nr:dienelactone hydrolase [Deinococcales bacterium]